MYVANCAAFEVLKLEHPEAAEKPKCIAGFSVGEWAALVAAGVITYDQCLIVIAARARAVQRWSQEEKMSAIGIYGLSEGKVRELCDAAVQAERVQGTEDPQANISHCWSPNGFVCAGRTSTIAALQKA